MLRRFVVACATSHTDKFMRYLLRDSCNMPFPVTTLSREKVNPKSPQAFRIYKFKKYISADIVRAKRRQF